MIARPRACADHFGGLALTSMAGGNGKPKTSERDFLAGQLLIAMPNMGDPRFDHAVIFLCAHNEDHAMGVIVNKRFSNMEVSDLLTQLEIEQDERARDLPVYFGGPVQTERGVVLHTLDYRLETTIQLAPDLGLTATKDVLIDIAGKNPNRPAPRRFLLAVGHAGWGSGQLEQEIAMNAWVHCDPDEAIIFDGAENACWKRALSKLGVTSAMLSPEWAALRRDDQPLN